MQFFCPRFDRLFKREIIFSSPDSIDLFQKCVDHSTRRKINTEQPPDPRYSSWESHLESLDAKANPWPENFSPASPTRFRPWSWIFRLRNPSGASSSDNTTPSSTRPHFTCTGNQWRKLMVCLHKPWFSVSDATAASDTAQKIGLFLSLGDFY
jgi:hypothetical protein